MQPDAGPSRRIDGPPSRRTLGDATLVMVNASLTAAAAANAAAEDAAADADADERSALDSSSDQASSETGYSSRTVTPHYSRTLSSRSSSFARPPDVASFSFPSRPRFRADPPGASAPPPPPPSSTPSTSTLSVPVAARTSAITLVPTASPSGVSLVFSPPARAPALPSMPFLTTLSSLSFVGAPRTPLTPPSGADADGFSADVHPTSYPFCVPFVDPSAPLRAARKAAASAREKALAKPRTAALGTFVQEEVPRQRPLRPPRRKSSSREKDRAASGGEGKRRAGSADRKKVKAKEDTKENKEAKEKKETKVRKERKEDKEEVRDGEEPVKRKKAKKPRVPKEDRWVIDAEKRRAQSQWRTVRDPQPTPPHEGGPACGQDWGGLRYEFATVFG